MPRVQGLEGVHDAPAPSLHERGARALGILRWSAAGWTATAAAVALAVGLFREIHHDQAHFLYIGKRILAGDRPYLELVEVNFPAIMYLSAIPVALHEATGLSHDASFVVCVWIWFVFSLWLFARLLPAQWSGGLGILLVLTGFVGFADHNFGQREHLFVLTWLPYLALKARRAEGDVVGGRLAALAGLWAGVGLTLKPHFFVFLAGAELLACRRGKARMAPELLGVGTVLALYLAHFLVLGRAYVDAFLQFSVIAGFTSNQAHSYPLPVVFNHLWPGAFVSLALVLALVGCARLAPPIREFSRQCALAAGLGLVLFLAQSKISLYHLVAFWLHLAVACVCIAVASRESPAGADAVRARRLGVAVALVVAAGFVLPQVRHHLSALRHDFLHGRAREPVAEFLREHTRPGAPVMVLSTNLVGPFPALLRSERRQATRYLWLNPLVDGLLRHDARAVDAVTGDLEREVALARPEAILIAETTWVLPPHRPAPLPDVLLGRPGLERLIRANYTEDDARLEGRYARAYGVSWDRYVVFRRRASAG